MEKISLLTNTLGEEYGCQEDVEQYAAELGVGKIKLKGTGQLGTAYITEKNTIIKITSDDTELEHARKLIRDKLKNVIHIYHIKNNMIHMELLDMGDAKDMFIKAVDYADDNCKNFGFDRIDADDENIPERMRKFIRDIQNGLQELRCNGVRNLDLKEDNVGMRGDDYIIFDTSEMKLKYLIKNKNTDNT